MQKQLAFLTSAIALGVAACGPASNPTPDAATEAPTPTPTIEAEATDTSIKIEDAYIRAPLEGRDVTAGFFTIQSIGGDASLVSASVERAETTELHTHEHVDGTMQMRRVDSVALPADEVVEFKPMGLHIMVFGVDETVAAGDVLEVTLTTEQNGTTETHTVQAEVRPLGG